VAESGLITSYEAAEMLGYEVQHVRRLLRSKRLVGEKKGRDWLVDRASVERYLARREHLDLPFGGSRTSSRRSRPFTRGRRP
jgi:excisionase family DNA binding protein